MSSNDSFQQAYQQMQEALTNGSLRRDLQGRRGADNQQRKLAEREIEYDDRGRKIPRPMFLRPEDIAKMDFKEAGFTFFLSVGVIDVPGFADINFQIIIFKINLNNGFNQIT